MSIDIISAISKAVGKSVQASKNYYDNHIKSDVNELLAYQVLPNEVGVVDISYKYGDIRRYGGIGDGITDDSDAIVNAFESQRKYPDIIITFEKDKTYICRKSPTFGTKCVIKGNNATLLIDELVGYKDNQIQFFWDNGYGGEIDIIDWSELNIHYIPELVTRSSGDTAMCWIFHLTNCKEFRMKDSKIIVEGDDRNHVNIFTFDGHGKIFVDNCYLKNTVRCKEDGSILWIQSKLSDGYFARITNCHFYSNNWDETVSCFCSGSHDVIIDGCTLEKYWYDSYYDRQNNLIAFSGLFLTNNYLSPSNFTEDEIKNISHNVIYKNCKMICKPLNTDSKIKLLGITSCGNVYSTPSMTKFINCDIEIDNLGQVVPSNTKNTYTNNIDWTNCNNVIFDNCSMKLSKFIAGRGLSSSLSTNIIYQNCKMVLDKLIYNQVWIESNICNCSRLIMRNNNILVTEAKTPLFKINPLSKEQYEIIGNNFITTDENGVYKQVELMSESQSADGYDTSNAVFYHSDNAEYNFYAFGNRINNRAIDVINKFAEDSSTS